MTKIFNFALKIKEGGREGGTCEVLRPCHPPKIWNVHYNAGFILRAMGCRSPLFSKMCRLGPIALSKGIGFPISSQISLILVHLYIFLLTFFQFLYQVPQFWQFLCFGLLYWPLISALFIFRAACASGSSYYQNWVFSEILSFGPFPNRPGQLFRSLQYSFLVQKFPETNAQ